MRKLAALSGALLLTLAMAAPAAANQKVWIPEFSGAFEWEQVMDVSTCTGPPNWEGWCEGWECIGPNDERLYYNGDWSGDMWLWYAKGIDTTDPAEYKPSDRPWPWIKGAAKGRGIDTYSTEPNMGGKVLSGKYNSNERFYDHEWTEDWETWTVQRTGKHYGTNAPGMGTVFHESGNLRYTIEQGFKGGQIVSFDVSGVRQVGNLVMDHDELCGFFGYTANVMEP
jgi:hypothetical protein